MGPRKTFKNELNPAMQFISRPGVAPEPEEAPSADPGHAPEAPARPHGKPPAGYKPNPAYIETKSKASGSSSWSSQASWRRSGPGPRRPARALTTMCIPS